jgi:hypothetical protein
MKWEKIGLMIYYFLGTIAHFACIGKPFIATFEGAMADAILGLGLIILLFDKGSHTHDQ